MLDPMPRADLTLPPTQPEAATIARLRDLIRRAHDAMSRREPHGVTEAEWDQLVADMAKELGL